MLVSRGGWSDVPPGTAPQNMILNESVRTKKYLDGSRKHKRSDDSPAKHKPPPATPTIITCASHNNNLFQGNIIKPPKQPVKGSTSSSKPPEIWHTRQYTFLYQVWCNLSGNRLISISESKRTEWQCVSISVLTFLRPKRACRTFFPLFFLRCATYLCLLLRRRTLHGMDYKRDHFLCIVIDTYNIWYDLKGFYTSRRWATDQASATSVFLLAKTYSRQNK